MKINIPTGSEINKTDNNSIKIRVPNTIFWTNIEQRPDKGWDIYLINPQTTYKELIRKNVETRTISMFSAIILKTPFPYFGKRSKNRRKVKRFINKITKIQKYARNKSNKTRIKLIRTKSSKIQINRKRCIKNGTNKSTINKNNNFRK